MKNPLKRSDWRDLLGAFERDLAGSPQVRCLDPISNAMEYFHALDADEIAVKDVEKICTLAKKFKECAVKKKDLKSKKLMTGMVSEVDGFRGDLKNFVQRNQTGVFLKSDWHAMKQKEFREAAGGAAVCVVNMDREAGFFHALNNAEITARHIDKLSKQIDVFRNCMKKQLDPSKNKHDAIALKKIGEMQTDAQKYFDGLKNLIKKSIS